MTTIFEQKWLPTRPYASDNLQRGVYKESKEKALKMKWVQAQPNNYKNLMVFDIDQDEAAWKIKTACYDDNTIPEPNYITTNPATGHAHIGYFLDAPVGTPKGLSYYNHIYKALQAPTGGDKAYGGHLTRNPLLQGTEWLTERLYTLKELEAYTSKTVNLPTPNKGITVNGRNDELFQSLRTYAYSAYRRLQYAPDALLTDLNAKAIELNLSHFTSPLTASESLHIAKSVHKWTTTNFTPKKFSIIQSKRAIRRWEATATERQASLNLILFLKEQKLSFQDISDNLSIPVNSVKSMYYRNLKA